MDERVRMWWEAYLSSLGGLRALGFFGHDLDVDRLSEVATKDAEAALVAYDKRWSEEEVPRGHV